MEETKKYDNWMKFLTVSVIVILVCVFTLTVTDTHLTKGTYGKEGDDCWLNNTTRGHIDSSGKCVANSILICSQLTGTCTDKNGNLGTWGALCECLTTSTPTPTAACDPDTVDSVTNECTALHRTFNNSTCACGNCITGYILEYGQCVLAPASSPCDGDTVDSVTNECTALHKKFNYGTCDCGDCMDGYVLQNGSCVPSSDCDINVSTSSVNVSVDSDGVDNSYYTVSVSYTGSCKGQTITYSATNAKRLSSTTYLITTSTAGITTFNVYPSDPCVTSVATAKLANGKSKSTSAVSTKTDWVSSPDCVENPTYKSFTEADRAGSNVYYSDPGTCNGHSG